MSLSAAAIRHLDFSSFGAGVLPVRTGLKLWKNGVAPTKETKKSFVRRPWAARVTQHLKVVTKLSEKKWLEIHEATQEVVAAVDNDFDPAEDGNNSDIDDPSELVQISESEAED